MTNSREIKAALNKKKEEFERYETVYESMPCIGFILNAAGNILSINQFGVRRLSYPSEKLVGESILNTFHPEDHNSLSEVLTCPHENSPQLVDGEFRQICGDGSLLWVRLSFQHLQQVGREQMFLLFCEEITETKQLKVELSLRDRQLCLITDSLPGKVSYVDSQQRYRFVSKQYGEWSKVSPEEILGQTVDGFMGALAYAQIRDYVEAALAGKKVSYEVAWNFDDGSERYLLIDYIPDIDESGEVLGFLTLIQDLTEYKTAEETLQQFNAELERQVQQRTVELKQALEKEKELGELKSRIIATISHEYRTPLTTIQSSAELLERYHQRLSEDKRLTHLHRIQVSTKHLTGLVNDVLFVGNAEAGGVECKPAPLYLEQLCQELVEQMRSNAQNQRTIIFSSRGNCITASLDEKLLHQIITNLLSNAIKYSPSGGIVRFDLECYDEVVTLKIQDCGIGIPSSDLPRLFESFHRASNVGTIPGTGLGLAIVKSCVDWHKGQITVDSVIGEGTTFTVRLPLSSY